MFSMLLKVSLVMVVCLGLTLAQYQYPGQTNSYRPSFAANGQRPGYPSSSVTSPSAGNPNTRILGLLGGGSGVGGLLGGGNRGGGLFGGLLGNLLGGGNRYPLAGPGVYGGAYPGAYGGYPGAYGGYPGYGGIGGYYG